MTDCVVVGGGLIGMMTARALIERGYEVRLIERGELAREASWAGGAFSPRCIPGVTRSPLRVWRAMVRRAIPTSHAVCTKKPASILSGYPAGCLSSTTSNRLRRGRHGVELEMLDAPGIALCEPMLAEGVAEQAAWLPGVARMRNPRLTWALRESLTGCGIAVEAHNSMRGLRVERARVVGVETEQGDRRAGSVVLAGGAWTPGLLAEGRAALNVRPVRGQMLVLRGEPGKLRRRVLLRDHYLIPRADGRIVVGSTLEEVGFDKRTTTQAKEELLRAACELMPELADWPIERQWSGLHPGSPNGVPVIAEHPRIGGLFVNAGHYRNGVVMGLASARLCADLVAGEPGPLDHADYAFPG